MLQYSLGIIQQFIEAQRDINTFTLKYKEAFDTDGSNWPDCTRILPWRKLEKPIRRD